MKIDWAALGLVSVVALVATVLVVGVSAAGVAAMVAAQDRIKQSRPSSGLKTAGYLCFGLAGAAVLFGIYLIVPLFH